MQSQAHFFYMRAVAANGFMQLVSGYAKFFRPIGNIRCHLRVNLLRVVRSLHRLFVRSVGLQWLGIVMVFSHSCIFLQGPFGPAKWMY
jgi:hypothetical protein